MPHIVAVETALPPNYYSQDELIAAFRELWVGKHFNLDRIEQFHRNVLVGGRHLALRLEDYRNLQGFANANNAWIQVALDLAETTVNKLLSSTGVKPNEIHEFVFTTVTGIAVPSIEARLMNRIPFSAQLKRVPIFGLGCLAGAAGISRVNDYLVGHPTEAAILLSVELCSLTLQREDLSVANIVSSGLFGDGAAAVLVVGDQHPLAKSSPTRILDSSSIFFRHSEEVMGWDMVDTGFKVVLSQDVAAFTKQNLRPGLEEFLKSKGLNLKDISHWIAHPGGPKVIQAMTESLDLPEHALRYSLDSLAQVGNLSSASVLFVLKATLTQSKLSSGQYGLLMAMGPAFCAEAVLLQWV